MARVARRVPQPHGREEDSKQTAHFGSLMGEWPGHRMTWAPPIETRWFEWTIDPERLVGSLELPESRIGRVRIPLEPFIGSIGVAPPMGRVEPTITLGEFGGNMDYRGLREGVTLWLTVWVDGAYLSFGDIHAQQGDGEVNGTAIEVTAEVTLGLAVETGRFISWPRARNEEYIIALGSARHLVAAASMAVVELIEWLVVDFDLPGRRPGRSSANSVGLTSPLRRSLGGREVSVPIPSRTTIGSLAPGKHRVTRS